MVDAEPFAYGIQAPIGSVTPLFHKRKDAEDYISKLTDSRDKAKIIPLYSASTTIETMLECWHRVIVQNEALDVEIARLRLTDAEREAVEFCDTRLREMACNPGAIAPQILAIAATLRGLLERTKCQK